ncbi:MAG: hypothetical protein AB1Z98_16615 [Nannocystaceae bacterium]
MATRDDEAEFEAAMRALEVAPLPDGSPSRSRDRTASRPSASGPAKTKRVPPPRQPAAHAPSVAPRRPAAPDPQLVRERDEARQQLAALQAQLELERSARERAEQARAQAEDEREHLRRALSTEQEQRRALDRTLASVPTPSSLRQLLAQRGAHTDEEITEVMLALLERDLDGLVDGLTGDKVFAARLKSRLSRVCDRPECQPDASVAVVHVPPPQCEVCGGSSIRASWEVLLTAARIAGVTRMTIVGGSPQYSKTLRDLGRGTDLKLDLVSGTSKRSRRRARSDAERVVIWASTILDHATSAAYEDRGEQLIRVTNRGISGMLRELATRLRPTETQ